VTIPKGVAEGSRIRVAGEGASGINSGARGDLYLRVHLELEPGTEVKGRDVYTDLPVRDYRAALGGTVGTQGPGGRLEVTVPEACPSGRTLRVPGKGIPAIRSGGKAGDLYLRVRLTSSAHSPLTDEERQGYLSLAKADGQQT
jgi:curved DNA-binding protein